MKKKAYLKCNYSLGIFFNEYDITFKDELRQRKFAVQEHEFFKKDKSSGLVSVIVTEEGEKNSRILIVGAFTGNMQPFCVPNEEIIPKQKLIKYLMKKR